MSDLRQRQNEYRSRAYLDGARGENCKLRFVGVCNHNPETVVACHITDTNFGLARKAHDFSIIDGCANCHMFLDHGWVGKISLTVRLQHIVRGLQETLLSRIERGIVTVKLDAPKPFADRPVKARKAKNERGKIVQRSAPIPQRVKLPRRQQHTATGPLQRKGDTI